MIAALLILVIVGLLITISYPLAKSSSYQEDDDFSYSPHMQELLSRKEATYAALKELEFDYGTGKLSESDYRELRDKYKAKAVSILKEIDGIQRENPIEAQIEQAVEELRLKTVTSGKREDNVSEVICRQCGALNERGDKFCFSCGQSLLSRSENRVCWRCGLPYQKGDKFCAGCGAAVLPFPSKA